MKKAVGRKVCGFKIVGRINELDNRWRFRRWFRKQLSLGSFEVKFSTRIYRVYRSAASSCRDFLLKSCISFARFPGILARSCAMPTDLLWPLLKVQRPFSFASTALIIGRPARIYNFKSSPALIFLRFQMEIRSRYHVKRCNYRGTRDPPSDKYAPERRPWCLFHRFRLARAVDLEKSSPTFKYIMKAW